MLSEPHVLIVDHAAIVRRVIARLVERVNPAATTVEAADLSEALSVLASRSFNVVVTDFLLPDGTGLELLAALQARHSPAPVLMVSGDRGLMGSALAAGAHAVLHKPFDIEELTAELRRVL
jgi:CheY-like chemotaxis protein